MHFIKIIFIKTYLLVAVANAAQIFAIVPLYGQSHWNVMDAVLQTLVGAGHNITVVTPFIKKEKIANYTEIDSSSYMLRTISLARINDVDGLNGIEYLIIAHQNACRSIYKSKDFWHALKSNKYDLFITQLLGSGCDSYIAHELKVPMIAVTTSAMPTWLNGFFGNPLITSYTSTLNVQLARPKNFLDRLLNTCDYIDMSVRGWWYDGVATELGRTYFGADVPDAHALMRKISLVFVNSHFSFDLPRPWVSNLIEIGGIHVTDPKPLPEDIQRFIDGASEGIIYFSFGSIIQMDSLPEKVQTSLQDAFSELPQRILWKYDSDFMKNQPKNVMIKKWFPQSDILAHPKLKLFVYHGGLSGMNEAILNQVPILGIPIFVDQYRNIANAVHLGVGVSLNYRTLDKQSFLAGAREVLNNEKYKKNAQELHRIFKDRPLSPKALVTYWTEYVIKHNGTEPMISAAVDLSWYQYHQFDVILFVLLIAISVSFIFSLCFKSNKRIFC